MTILSTKRTVMGESFGHHDGALAVVTDYNKHRYAYWTWGEQTERYTGVKHDKRRHPGWNQKHFGAVERAFYERPIVANARRLISGESLGPRPSADHYINHHWAHAASAYYTRPWDDSIEPVCVVIDAIGEFDTASIWYKKKKVWSMPYPQSLGLFYAAITQACGMVPNRDEHLVMALAAYGNYNAELEDYFFEHWNDNLHKGFKKKEFDEIRMKHSREDIARAGQHVLTKQILDIMHRASKYSAYLCYSGGVALNCVANTEIWKTNLFNDIWIFPNPGDAGTALGAALAVVDKRIEFDHNFYGSFAKQKPARDAYTDKRVPAMVNELMATGVIGITNGCGEFGPRALGQRSFIALPTTKAAKKVRDIKSRPDWSPLAPVVLEEDFDSYFHGPKNEHMTFVSHARDFTKVEFPEVVHIDGTARVQCLGPRKTQLRAILERLRDLHDIPMVINTSLNMRHAPMPAGRLSFFDEESLERSYGVKVF